MSRSEWQGYVLQSSSREAVQTAKILDTMLPIFMGFSREEQLLLKRTWGRDLNCCLRMAAAALQEERRFFQ